MSAVHKVVRSPPSPLENDYKRGKIMASRCFICTKNITNSTNQVSCSECEQLCHSTCAFINPVQENFFIKNNIQWMCQCCYFAKIGKNSKAVYDLQKSVNEIKESLEICLDRVTAVSSQISSVHQELSHRVTNVESKVEVCDYNVSQIIEDGLPNMITVNGLNQKMFNKDGVVLREYISKLLDCFGVDVNNCIFDFNWSANDELQIFFLDRSFVRIINQKYTEMQKPNKSGIFTEDFEQLNSILATTITVSVKLVSYETSLRLDNLEIEKLSRDIKVNGIQYLPNETNALLQKYFMDITTYLNAPINCASFKIRRIKKTKSCIVTFGDTIERDKVFYAYMNYIKSLTLPDAGGISKNILTQIPCEGNIYLSDNLSNTSRTINHFCFTLKKQYKKIAAFSTRRGKVVVKLLSGESWIMVNSLRDLHYIIDRQQSIPKNIPSSLISN